MTGGARGSAGSGSIRFVSRALIAAGVIALSAAVYVAVSAAAFQTSARESLRKDAVRVPVSGAAPPEAVAAPRPAEGSALGAIRIARLGMDVVFAEGESDAVLRRAVGHLPATAFPGEAGNVVLAGHRDTFFRPLRHIRTGDAIQLATPRGDFHYMVEWTRVVLPTAVDVLDDAGTRTLTLITCFPFDFVGSAPKRFLVRARQVLPVGR